MTQAAFEALLSFWKSAGPAAWFTKDPTFDRTFRERFLALHEEAARGEHRDWLSTANGALALTLLLDQFPRNAFRDTVRMYATDPMARDVANAAIERGYDNLVDPQLRFFFYLPFAHSESLADQDRSVELHERIAFTEHAIGHRDIVKRFGRFPHRNGILGRPSTAEELAFLKEGGFGG